MQAVAAYFSGYAKKIRKAMQRISKNTDIRKKARRSVGAS
jgi:hypothetical protein